MIHLVLHFPKEAILDGPVYMQWMYPFERYLKRLKDYVRNASKPEGSISEGYVVDEALPFCSRYFDDRETRFNWPDRNDDGIHQPGSSSYSNLNASQWENSHKCM